MLSRLLLLRHHPHLPSPRPLSTTTSHPPRPFSKILVANRGEIACRIIRTCRRLQIPTVALTSPIDAHALHATLADEVVPLGSRNEPIHSYLRSDDILTIALETGARAIHPGYGFLSENASFARLCAATDGRVTFVGPSGDAIAAMGSKSVSKEIMTAAGVPCTPGYHGDDRDDDHLHAKADEMGYPVLIKAVSGGGGKGMRIVSSSSSFLSSLRSCRSESRKSFGDDGVILERYLRDPRHVEVQILGDRYGNVVSLHERDCSLQRRHQKIIEEAPAPGLSDEVRKRLGEVAVKAGEAVGYVGAGTVEFLMEGDDFYFCEMNTRLQVEHPVTEMITGVDLVEWQLRVAAGERLDLGGEVKREGHAFEARIYAEDVGKGFLPAAGKLEYCKVPTGEGVRVDTGVRQGDDVSVYYDPMISKLITHGPDRLTALTRLQNALQQYHIVGLPTNISFLQRCARHPSFVEGGIDTGFLERHADDERLYGGSLGTDDDDDDDATDVVSNVATVMGTVVAMLEREGRRGVSNLAEERRRRSPWSSLNSSWRNTAPETRRYECTNGTSVAVTSHRDGSFDMTVGRTGGDDDDDDVTTIYRNITATLDDDGTLSIIVDRKRYTVSTVVRRDDDDDDGRMEIHLWAAIDANTPSLGRDDERHATIALVSSSSSSSARDRAADGEGEGGVVVLLAAPMPGTVARVDKSIGDDVTEGDVVLVLEAMKMEHAIVAPRDGVLVALDCGVGDIVGDGAVLARVGTREERGGDGGD